MPIITTVGDISVGTCACCCDGCPHPWVSVHVVGARRTKAEGRYVMRAPNDLGVSSCPHCPTSFSVTGASRSYVEGKRIHRVGDVHNVGCGTGVVVSGRASVKVE